ncbi:HTH domain-containing protein [Streptomyces albidoflavus]|uniref:HTH domain-containing protein n=1 Tax=Streptomyces albidoflavus TaxID=1886 RepID=UPI0033DB1178
MAKDHAGGLSADAIQLYRRAVGRTVDGSAPGAAELIAGGLLTGSPLAPDRFTAVDPRDAERRRIDRLMGVLNEAAAEVRVAANRAELLSDVVADASAAKGSEVLEGADAANARISEVLPETRTSYRSAQPGPRPDTVVHRARGRDSALFRLRPQVLRRGIYHDARRHDPAVVEYVRTVAPLGMQVRTLGGVFPKVMIFDRAHAFVPLREDGRAAGRTRGAVHVTDPLVVDALTIIWDIFWEMALPWEEEREPEPAECRVTERQRQIMGQLLAGRTQTQLAERLGISTTVVQQDLAALRKMAGVSTNFQLGPWWVQHPRFRSITPKSQVIGSGACA